MFREGARRAYFKNLDGLFPDFRPRATFNFDNHPHWFIGHMSKGKTKIMKRLKDVDVVLEVRDARAPFSSAQTDMLFDLGPEVKRLVILNKADLVTPTVGMQAQTLIEEAGTPCLLTNAAQNKNLVKIKNFAMDNCRSKYPRTLGLMLMVIGLPNVGKSTIINGLKSVAFSTARKQGKDSKLVSGMKWTQARAYGEPGVTRDVNFFQLANKPRLYCYDTPGVSLLKVKIDPERNTKLALLKTMPDHMAGEMYLADYLLYRLNKAQLFDYIDHLDLPGPTDDVRYLCSHVSALLAHRKQVQLYFSRPTDGAKFFIEQFREGHLGKLCLDHIPGPDEMRKLRQLRTQAEPPGPWGPPCYPSAPLGLELDDLRNPKSGMK
mmetsp:Transcript_96896/g.211861  ORF Transcript_96896/g.211861 Transcript_96896/m.211861 type:complete len:377 (+) Transcript_96896:56-1186(+)